MPIPGKRRASASVSYRWSVAVCLAGKVPARSMTRSGWALRPTRAPNREMRYSISMGYGIQPEPSCNTELVQPPSQDGL